MGTVLTDGTIARLTFICEGSPSSLTIKLPDGELPFFRMFRKSNALETK